MQPFDLWTLIGHLPTRAPFTKEGLEQAFRIVLLREEIANEYFDSFGGGHVPLANEMEVKQLEFRVSKKDPVNKWMLWLLLAGRCAERAEVLARYADLKITQSPRGGSLDEETKWSRQEPWGRLSFGFAERDFNCLRSVVFGGPKW
jgi:hypothetical protein